MKLANKKENNYNIYNAAFFKKKQRKKLAHYQNLEDKNYSS